MQASTNKNEMTVGSNGQMHGGLIEPMHGMSKDAQRVHAIPNGSGVAEKEGSKVAQEAKDSQSVKPHYVRHRIVMGQTLDTWHK